MWHNTYMKKWRNYFHLIFVLLLIAGSGLSSCSSAENNQKPTNSIFPTDTQLPIADPSRTPTTTLFTPTNTSIPIEPTATQATIATVDQLDIGTYIALVELLEDHIEIKFVNTDGSGYIQYVVPVDHAEFYASPSGLSPDGNFFAYYTGLDPAGHLLPPYELTLHIVSLESGETITLIPLLSENFPDNFIELAQTEFAQALPEATTNNHSIEELATLFLDGFEYGIFSLGWSADGRYLAFAGQMEGLSSDIYVYDIFSQTYKRVSFGPEQIQSLYWTDDNRIFYSSSYHGPSVEVRRTYHIVSFDGSSGISFPRDLGAWDAGWLSPTHFLRYSRSVGADEHDLYIFETNTGQAWNIWPYPFTSLAVDPYAHTILITSHPILEEQVQGLYLLSNLGRYSQKISEIGSYGVFINHPTYSYFVYIDNQPALITKSREIQYLDVELSGQGEPSPNGRMLIFPYKEGTKLYMVDTGEVIEIPKQDSPNIRWSPDSNFIAIYNAYLEQPLAIYSVETGEIYDTGELMVGDLLWVADSSGLFILSEGAVYYSTPNGDYQVTVDQNYQAYNPIYLDYKVIVIE